MSSKRWIFLLLLVPLSGCVVNGLGWDHQPNYVTTQSSEPRQDEELIDARVSIDVGSLEIAAGHSGTLYDADVYYDKEALEPTIRVNRDGRRASFNFDLKSKKRNVPRQGKTRVTLNFDPDTELRLDLESGVAKSEVDLSDLRLRALEMQTGVGESQLTMLTPNKAQCERVEIQNGVGKLSVTGLGNFGFDRLIYEGGVGAAELEFSGAWQKTGKVEVRLGIGAVQLVFPRDLGVELKVSASPFSGLDISGFEKRGSVYRSSNMDRVDKRIEVTIESGIGGIDVEWM